MKYNNVLELIGNTPIIKIDDDITKLKYGQNVNFLIHLVL